jgi:hypothetical protein
MSECCARPRPLVAQPFRAATGHTQIRKTAEIPVGGPQLTDTVKAAQRGDTRIVDQRTGYAPRDDQGSERRPIRVFFGEQYH